MDPHKLNQELGNIDIYLLDQILKGHYKKEMKILDAGCGEGRNSIYFLKNEFSVYGVDKNPAAIRMIKMLARSIDQNAETDNFLCEDLTQMSFKNDFFDAIICSATLHFARSKNEFWEMFNELNRVLKPGGSFFIRMTSNMGIANHASINNGVFKLGDGSIRFLFTDELMDEIVNKKGYCLIEPYKSVVVEGKRSMNVLMMLKNLK